MAKIKTFIVENIDLKSDDSFSVFNVEDVIHKHQNWLRLLPRVVPHYAIKANRFPLLLELMIALGLSFDCASQFEIEEMVGRGVKPENIIFANPCKSIESIKCSKRLGIDLLTFDNQEELIKIYSIFPSARLVIRIKVDDSNSNVRLGVKFGADLDRVESLLRKAKELQMNLMGIAFHVGSSCQSAQSYVEAIMISRRVFEMARNMGFQMSLIDIGGGFPGCDLYYYKQTIEKSVKFEEMAIIISKTLDEYYPEQNLTIIGEPGRYYCESAFTLFSKILSKNIVDSKNGETIMYYINDGIYGSFSDGIIDKKTFNPLPLLKNEQQLSLRKVYPSIIWGPTCDSADCIGSDFQMHEMFIGEWLLFEDMGAYSLPYCEYGFNGMPSPKYKVFVTEFAENILIKTLFWSKCKSIMDDSKWSDIYAEKVWYQMG